MNTASGDIRTTKRTRSSDGPQRVGQRSACLVVIHGEGLGKRADLIDGQSFIIGRSQDANLRLANDSVSRRHCEVRVDDDGYRIRDLGATNTTRVNDQPIDECSLSDGDYITVGESVLKFISRASVEASYHEEIHNLASYDALTNLCNRRRFFELTERELVRARRSAQPLALAILDIDLFKAVNDRFGHLEGDRVLEQIADLLRLHGRATDTLARIGGEEFAILLPDSNLDVAVDLVEVTRKAVEASTFAPGGVPRQITISAGIALFGADNIDRSTLFRSADRALYHAKNSGRNRVCRSDQVPARNTARP